MIELKNINKTYNKGKVNEIKAIKQTNLTFPEKGLMVIIGPSGSGKTTLLNVIGGLEYIDSGEMIIDDIVIKKRHFRKLDRLRNQRIGYIFQQYNLLPNLTVYQNIEFVLKMLGVKNKEEIDNRIHYVLHAVGMYNYRNRKIITLSGGQQQKIGIARAIAKNPDMIIADEPTGNLDSRNTVEIMNIIKKISEQKLVVLVTHEKEIAQFYGDRIIEINDGMISKDYVNSNQGLLDIKHNNTIYLKDLKNENLVKNPIDITHYSDDTFKEEIKVTLISYNDTLYISVDGKAKEKVRLIKKDSDVKIFDEHYKGLAQEEVKHSFDFQDMSIGKNNYKRKTVVRTLDAIKYALIKIKGYKRLQKLLFLGFFFSAMLIAVSISLIGKVYHVIPTDFQTVDKHYILTSANVDDLNKMDTIQAINPLTDPITMNLHIEQFYQVRPVLEFKAHPTDINLLKEKDILYGKYPQKENEVVIDKQVAIILINNPEYNQAGINTYKELLNLTISDTRLEFQKTLKIVGISNLESPTIWMNESYIYEIAINHNRNIKISTWDETTMTLVEGRIPTTTGEILYPENLRGSNNYKLNDEVTSEDFKKLKIVGFYQKSNYYLNYVSYLTTNELLKDNYHKLFRKTQTVLVYSNNIDETIDNLNSINKQADHLYKEDFLQYKKDMKQAYHTLMAFSSFLLGMSLLQLYFIIRTSLLNRIYEIGVYRSLGATKWDIHKMFLFEIIMITTVTSTIGYIIATYIIKEIEKIVPYPYTLFYFPVHYIIGGMILIYLINLVSGLYPVYRLTRNSPSQILKKYDA